jgi:arylformamidase
MLYRGMDRAQLDAAYNNLAAVPSSPKLLADWAPRSARFRERHHGHLGLAYGERPRERLDLFLAGDPRGADPGLHPRRLLAKDPPNKRTL